MYKYYNESVDIKKIKLPDSLKALNYRQCRELCQQIREILITTVSKTGGHLASNLGTVELTMAIHRVFNLPKDKIVWDVGHQAYTHKILTGRLDRFSTLRQKEGISGFPKPCESEYDSFISGHSSNSISAACGIAKAMRLNGKDNNTVAVIGDGALTGGLAYEGLNNAGKCGDNIIIILNHNDMSISKNVGAVAKYLTTIRSAPEYLNTKSVIENVLNRTPVVGKPLIKALCASKSAIKSVLYHSTMFEDFGFIYLGPVDGHNEEELEKTLETAKAFKKPVFVHVNTVKGKGFAAAEKNPGAFHGVPKFEISTGNPEVISCDSYSAVFGKELDLLADEDKSICAITAAMKYGTGLQYFHCDHKERFFDVGIAEQHAVTFAAGLASSGMKPVVAIYSSFLQRTYDQILHDCAICNYHILLCIDRAGFVGEDGETHQGLYDVAFLTTIPNVTLYSPSCYEELRICLKKGLYEDTGIVGIRYPRGNDNSNYEKVTINTAYTYKKQDGRVRSEIIILTYGRIFNNLLEAKKILNETKVTFDIIKLTKIFPVSVDIINIIKQYKKVIIFEEGIKNGSIAEHISFMLSQIKFSGKVRAVTIEGFVKQASVSEQMQQYNLSTDGMIKVIQEVAENSKTT